MVGSWWVRGGFVIRWVVERGEGSRGKEGKEKRRGRGGINVPR